MNSFINSFTEETFHTSCAYACIGAGQKEEMVMRMRWLIEIVAMNGSDQPIELSWGWGDYTFDRIIIDSQMSMNMPYEKRPVDVDGKFWVRANGQKKSSQRDIQVRVSFIEDNRNGLQRAKGRLKSKNDSNRIWALGPSYARALHARDPRCEPDQ